MYYKTTFQGDFSIEFLNENQIEVLVNYIDKHPVLSEVSRVDRNTKVIYFSGDIDNSGDVVEALLLKISGFAPDDFEATIVAKGESVEDRRDLIIKEKTLFVMSYELVPGECVRYIIPS